jgi:hypothetical protein
MDSDFDILELTTNQTKGKTVDPLPFADKGWLGRNGLVAVQLLKSTLIGLDLHIDGRSHYSAAQHSYSGL